MLSVLLLLFVFVVSVASALGRASWRRRQQELALRRAQEHEDHGGGASPLAGMPCGPLFGQMMGGAWTRSYAYTLRTGERVNVSDVVPELEPDRAAPSRDEDRESASQPTGAGRGRRPRPRAAARANPLASLLGGLGGGMGQGRHFEVQPPDELITFAGANGKEAIKQEARDTVGPMLAHFDEAERYGIERNGILLHGPPGVGKTFFAQALAGEYRPSFIHVSIGDLVSSLQGGSTQNIDKAFDTALRKLPCVLFFDEFDSVAQRRSGTPDQESRRTVNQLLTALEAHRDERELVVVAACNEIEHLDPAVIRPGRFDRHSRIDFPDAPARRAIFEAELDERPVAPGIDFGKHVRPRWSSTGPGTRSCPSRRRLNPDLFLRGSGVEDAR